MVVGCMLNKLYDKIMEWLYSKILTYELWKWFRAHRYSENKERKNDRKYE